MLPFRNPLVWLWRFPHRKGYGIHSPFAFSLVTQVLYSPGRYYAYDWLDELMPRWQRKFPSRRRACLRLLFRLANFWQPHTIEGSDQDLTQLAYLHAGCKAARLVACQSDIYALQSDNGTMFVIYDLQRHRSAWRSLLVSEHTRVSFDLHDMGIVVCDPKLNKQHYIINW